MATITIRQFEMALRATIEKKLKRSIMVLGPTGIGKSEVIDSVAASYNMPTIDVRLLLWSLTDLKGIPFPDETKTYTKWLINDILPREDRDGPIGILKLEEINEAPNAVKAAAYQLTLDRKIGDYKLPDGWIIVATSNRAIDGSVSAAPPPPALADRFEIYELDVDFPSWKSYAIKAGINPIVITYLSRNLTVLHTYKPDEEGELVFATPRSWSAVAQLLDVGFTGELLQLKVEANIGIEAASFLKYMKDNDSLPNIEAILDGAYRGNNSYIASLDVYYLLVQNLIYSIGTALRDKNEDLHKWLDNSIEFLGGIGNFPLDLKKSYVDQLCELDSGILEYFKIKSREQAVGKLMQELEYVGV